MMTDSEVTSLPGIEGRVALAPCLVGVVGNRGHHLARSFRSRGGRDGDAIIRVHGALPESVRYREVHRKGKRIDGALEAVLEPSPMRAAPTCQWTAACGGVGSTCEGLIAVPCSHPWWVGSSGSSRTGSTLPDSRRTGLA